MYSQYTTFYTFDDEVVCILFDVIQLYGLYTLTLSARGPFLYVIIWRIISNGRRPINNIGIQMKQKELTKTFMMISNWEKHFCLLFLGLSQILAHAYCCPSLRPSIRLSATPSTISCAVLLEVNAHLPWHTGEHSVTNERVLLVILLLLDYCYYYCCYRIAISCMIVVSLMAQAEITTRCKS